MPLSSRVAHTSGKSTIELRVKSIYTKEKSHNQIKNQNRKNECDRMEYNKKEQRETKSGETHRERKSSDRSQKEESKKFYQ